MAKTIFCVIPAYNEEARIAGVIDSVVGLVDKVVVVNDGSSDNTAAAAQSRQAVVISHLVNRGQGAALMTGNLYALKNGADIIVHFDADGQFRAEDLPAVVEPILAGRAEAVFGSRFLGKRSELPALKRYAIIPLAHLANYLILGFSLSDPQSGFRALSREVAAKIDIRNDGAAHCSEIMHKVSKLSHQISEVPIVVNYSRFGQGFFRGKGRGSGGIKIIKDLLIQKIID